MEYPTQEDLVPITFSKEISEEKLRENSPENMSVLQNDVCSTPKYVKILMDSGASVLSIHDLFVLTNKFNARNPSANKWLTMAQSWLTSCEAEAKIKHPK